MNYERVPMPDACDPFLAPNLKLEDKKQMFQNFHFLKSDMVFGIVNAISSEKSYLISRQ